MPVTSVQLWMTSSRPWTSVGSNRTTEPCGRPRGNSCSPTMTLQWSASGGTRHPLPRGWSVAILHAWGLSQWVWPDHQSSRKKYFNEAVTLLNKAIREERAEKGLYLNRGG